MMRFILNGSDDLWVGLRMGLEVSVTRFPVAAPTEDPDSK